MSGLVAKVYRGVFRRTSTFILVAAAGAFFFERGFDMATDRIYDRINEGKLYKHIKHRFEEQEN